MTGHSAEHTITTILSTNFAGSHFLSLMLGSHSEAMHIGEIRHRRRIHSSNDSIYCRLCGTPEECPLYAGLGAQNIENVYDQIFRNMDSPGLRMLVDNSKKVQWARIFQGNDTYQMKYIHLMRDPRALVRRWHLSYITSEEKKRQRVRGLLKMPLHTWSWLCGSDDEVYMHKWLYQNREISRFIAKHKLDAITVTYHDLAKYSEREIQRLCAWLGLDFEKGQLEYWNFPHHGTQKLQYQWVKDKKTRYFDTRWRESLPQPVLKQISRNRLLQKYIEKCGLEMGEEGLERV